MVELYRTTVSDLGLEKPTKDAFEGCDFQEEITDVMNMLEQYDGSRIYGASEMIVHGVCPECAGNSCMDGDYENGEDTCNGSTYDCDQGEIANASWLSLAKYSTFQNQLTKAVEAANQ